MYANQNTHTYGFTRLTSQSYIQELSVLFKAANLLFFASSFILNSWYWLSLSFMVVVRLSLVTNVFWGKCFLTFRHLSRFNLTVTWLMAVLCLMGNWPFHLQANYSLCASTTYNKLQSPAGVRRQSLNKSFLHMKCFPSQFSHLHLWVT